MHQESRFRFGRNWAKFLRHVTEEGMARAEASLIETIGKEGLAGKNFLDIGSGSGLFSLAARRLGAKVTSFDYDRDSVQCAQDLKERFYPHDDHWTILQGSVLDPEFMEQLGRFDVVYAWGVLHHSGDQWKGLARAMAATRPGGTLLVALYNDQGWLSRYWTTVKWLYMHVPIAQPLLIAFYAPYFIGLRWVVRFFKRQGVHERGMSLWYDMIDWLGGWPFEVAAPQDVLARGAEQGFQAVHVKTVGRRQGCNEFVLVRKPA
ncbi:MAG: methyltransferase domain-containing protein [Nitrospira sp. CR1.3]|nr:methyltransferase domain-containing protein [Nitrospira sp. CR1.3]